LFWRPDDQETRELMRRHRVFRPSELNPLVTPEIDRVVVASLARDPARRVQTAADLCAALARIRVAQFPEATPQALGELVVRVLAMQVAEEESAAAVLPSTAEIGAVNNGARVETFAAQPIATQRISGAEIVASEPASSPPAPVVEEPVAPAAVASGPLTNVTVTTTNPARPVVAAGFVLVTAALIVWGVGALADRSSSETETAEPVLPVIAQDPKPVETATVALVEPELVVEQPIVTSEAKEKKKPRTVITPPPQSPATVSFGTRSCSSRVSVDGVIIARSTPSYDHKISAGEHTISIEGTTCPLIERPGSLKPALPMVVKRVQVTPGARLKMIADFSREELAIREE
jgi:hypothetical protein